MAQGDIKYKDHLFVVSGELAGTVELGDVVCNTGAGWVEADTTALATSDAIAVTLSDGDSADEVALVRTGVVEVGKASGIAVFDGEIVEVDNGEVDTGGTAVSNAVYLEDAGLTDTTVMIRIW